MKKTIIAVAIAVAVAIIALVGIKVFLFSDSDGSDDGPVVQSQTNIPVTQDSTGQADTVVPSSQTGTETQSETIPEQPASTENPVRLLDIGIASFNYDSTKLIFDEIPSDEEDGTPMVSFMPIDATEAVPRVDAMPLTVSMTGEGDQNFYNMTEESWKNLAAALILNYYSSTSQNAAQIEMSDAVVKIEGTASKMYVNVNVSIPQDIADQTGDYSLTAAIRLVSNGQNAIVTMALTRLGGTLPQALHDAYMSVSVNP